MRGRLVALLLALAPLGAVAQDDLALGQVQSPVLVIDAGRLLAESRAGQAIDADLRARADALAAENRQLEAELTSEERALTERRPTMEVEAFRAEAEAFDARVQAIRSEQDAKQRELEEAVDRSREDFLTAVRPVLAQLMIESGAAVILERREVFLSVGLVDVTDEAIAAIDAEMGEGAAAPDRSGAETAPSGDATPSEATDPATPPAATDGPEAVPGD
ncbi:OmpH family outer membrane protein [Rubellimicrobium roseum]|uniref:OmpH family outer membrane protein n=1 Tax=Rubellimicrobium roseum TaxID=687525 RepID=A0A5C4NA98_9RHOB|nr:OmpH family outer membrane protein [Rubellimicrobium roseum]TNC69494.1 OmpH family outer membrane protein [Rubellimicrobium roseum]